MPRWRRFQRRRSAIAACHRCRCGWPWRAARRAGRAATAAARLWGRPARAVAPTAASVACVARAGRPRRLSEPTRDGLAGADGACSSGRSRGREISAVRSGRWLVGGSGAAPMGRARPGSGPRTRQASLERRRRVCAAAVVAHARTWHISHYITFFEIARDRVTHACMDNGPNVFLYSFYDMPVCLATDRDTSIL